MTLASGLAKVWMFLTKGGVLTWPILACSVIAVALIFERWFYFWRVQGGGEEWFDEFISRVRKREWEPAARMLSQSQHPSARVLSALLVKAQNGAVSRSALEQVANHAGGQVAREVERFLPALSTIASVAPLLGLMGTVLGLIKAFMVVEDMGGKVNASLLAGGVWEALLTTLYGLGVAIPTVIAHNYLSSRAQRIIDELQDQAVSFIEAVEESAPPLRQPSAPTASAPRFTPAKE